MQPITSKLKKLLKKIKSPIVQPTLQFRIFSIFSALFLFAIIIFSIVVFSIYEKNLILEVGRSRLDVLRQVSERTNLIKNNIITISNLYYFDERVAEAILNNNESPDTKKILEELKERYTSVFNKVNLKYYSVIIGENGFEYCSLDNVDYDFDWIKNQLWFNKILDSYGEIVFISSYPDSPKRESANYVFSAARTIYSNDEKIGTLIINIEEKYLNSTYKSALGNGNSIYIIDEKGNIISHSN